MLQACLCLDAPVVKPSCLCLISGPVNCCTPFPCASHLLAAGRQSPLHDGWECSFKIRLFAFIAFQFRGDAQHARSSHVER